MPHWLIKSTLHRGIACLPRSHWWNDLLQTHVSKSLDLDPARFELRLEYARRHLENFQGSAPVLPPNFSVLELGTGWYPVVPVGFYLSGADAVWTFDIAPLLRRQRVEQMLRLFVEYDRVGVLRKWLPQARPERLARLREILAGAANATPEALLQSLNIHPLVRDAQATGLPDRSINLFVSTSVLEYVPRPVLANMLTEFKRLARPGAIASDFINLLDEFCHFDRSITPFNFLQYTDRQWRYLDSPLLRKNRLRLTDYREIFAQAGRAILREENTSGRPEDLEKIRLAPEFRRYAREDLLVLQSWLVAKPINDGDQHRTSGSDRD